MKRRRKTGNSTPQPKPPHRTGGNIQQQVADQPLEGGHAASRTPNSDFLSDQLQSSVHSSELLLEDAGIALFPDLPVH
jgi:hypothetical protein